MTAKEMNPACKIEQPKGNKEKKKEKKEGVTEILLTFDKTRRTYGPKSNISRKQTLSKEGHGSIVTGTPKKEI